MIKRRPGVFGIQAEGQVTVMIHCGSRGLGHQVASDYIEIMENAFGTKGLPDRELVNAPVRSRLGQEYYASMCAAVNFAFANRQMIAHWVRDVFARVMGSSEGMRQIYDVCHNVAKIERHDDWRPRARGLHPPEGRHPELRAGTARDPGGLPAARPARHHPGQHGDGVLSSGRDGRGGGPELQFDRPRRGTGHVPARGAPPFPRRADP